MCVYIYMYIQREREIYTLMKGRAGGGEQVSRHQLKWCTTFITNEIGTPDPI